MKPSKDETVVAHYGKLLGLEAPWEVRAAQLDLLRGRVELEVAWAEEATVVCPECGQECARHDHAPERAWRQLNVRQFLTVIKARAPRCRCAPHGVKTVRPPWAEPGSHFTLHFEAFAVQLIGACRSLTQVAELLALDWDGVQRPVERAVARGLARRSLADIRWVGLDEKSFLRGQSYVSVMSEIAGARVLEVVLGRERAAGEALWQVLPAGLRKKAAAAAMDLSGRHVAATHAQAPQAAMVHDEFQVAKLLNEAGDRTRRAEHARWQAKGDDPLTGTRYLWLHGLGPERQQASFARTAGDRSANRQGLVLERTVP